MLGFEESNSGERLANSGLFSDVLGILPKEVTVNTHSTQIVIPPRAAAERLGVSFSTLNRLRQSGRLPAPIRLSDRRIAYRVADLDAFLAARTDA